MADSKIRKVVIPKEKLPSYNGVNQSYTVRYRIVSEDRNRTSHWSPQYKLAAPEQDQTTEYSVSVDSAKKVLSLVWEQPADLNSLFDIYVKWDNQSWKYVGQEVTTRFTTLIPTGTEEFMVAVQVPTFPRERFDGATLFETDVQSLVV